MNPITIRFGHRSARWLLYSGCLGLVFCFSCSSGASGKGAVSKDGGQIVDGQAGKAPTSGQAGGSSDERNGNAGEQNGGSDADERNGGSDGQNGGAGEQNGGSDADERNGGSGEQNGGSDGQNGTSGSSGGADLGHGVIDAGCAYTGDPLINVSRLVPCPLCQNARCIPSALLSTVDTTKLGSCETSGSKCVPDYYIETGGKFLLKTCASLKGAEGRCLSLCIPDVAVQKDRLPMDICAEDERCAPCYDPITGEDTGSCRVSCDTGPSKPVLLFDTCCGGLSVCVPENAVDAKDRAHLGKDTCTAEGFVCAPTDLAKDPIGFKPKTCVSWQGAEGRCQLACLPEVAAQKSRLSKDICDDGYLCAPCFDQMTGEDTHACRTAGDQPLQQNPVLFTECCGGISVCVPPEAVPVSQRAPVNSVGCTEHTDYLCVPKEMAGDPTGFVPSHCVSWDGAEARCLSTCLPEVADVASRIAQETCDAGYLCAPCYDQVDGQETNACHAAGDPGPTQQPKVVFEKCCGGISSCIPVAAVQVKDRANLDKNTCSKDDHLCVPDVIALAPTTYVPPTCQSWGHAEGRCLPECLPDISSNQAKLTKGGCTGPQDLCAPCVDPVTGAQTSACTTAGDTGPKNSAYTFAKCCNVGGRIRGTCIPRALAGAQAASLRVDTCPSGQPEDFLCAPNEKIADPAYIFPECSTSWLARLGGYSQKGACVPQCMVSSDQVTLLGKQTCGNGEVCAPCSKGSTSTGACE